MQYVFLEYSIDCAHFLPNVPEGHKCGTMHGHRYEIRLEVAGVPAKASGWIIDYTEIKEIADPVIMALDHQTLNTVLGLENPTCENLVGHILQGTYILNSLAERKRKNETDNWSNCAFCSEKARRVW